MQKTIHLLQPVVIMPNNPSGKIIVPTTLKQMRQEIKREIQI